MGAYDSSLGVLLIGTWANAMFYMLEICQVVHYWTEYPSDSRNIKVLVLAILAIDTLGTASTFGTVYMYCVTFWGNTHAIQKEYWSYPVYCTATAVSAAIGQSFLISRFFSISRNYVVTMGLSLLSLTAIGGALWTVIVIIPHNTLSARSLLTTPVIVWFGGSTACDVCLAACLVWQLQAVKTSFRNTETMLRRLTRAAISTGSVTGAWALLILIVFVQNPGGSVAVAFNTCFGRVYALTVLYNLNMRHTIRSVGAKNVTTVPTRADVEASQGNTAIDLTQIRVEQTVNVISDVDSTKGKGITFTRTSEDEATPSESTEYDYEAAWKQEIKKVQRSSKMYPGRN